MILVVEAEYKDLLDGNFLDGLWIDYLGSELSRVLGINDFSDRGSVVNIGIKTEPLKQWEVIREFRRRLL